MKHGWEIAAALLALIAVWEVHKARLAQVAVTQAQSQATASQQQLSTLEQTVGGIG